MNAPQRKSCYLRGFEFSILYYEETKIFYQKLGFIVHREVEEKTTKSIWFRDQRFEPDVVDDRTSFFVFTWNKDDSVLQVMDKALPRDEGFMLTIHTRNILSDFDDINSMQDELGCHVETQPMAIVDKDILIGTVIDPNGMSLQFVQFANNRFYVEEDESVNNKGSNLAFNIKFGDVYIVVEFPERSAKFIEKIFSSREEQQHPVTTTAKNNNVYNGNSDRDASDKLVSSTTINDVNKRKTGIYIVDREEFPTASAELIWLGSHGRSISSSLCLYSHTRRSADITSLGKASTITSKEEKNHLLIGCLISVNDLHTFTKMIDVHSMKGSDVSRLLEEKQIVTSIDMSNDNKIFTYFPLGKIPLKLKLYIPTVDELILPQAKDDDDEEEDDEEEEIENLAVVEKEKVDKEVKIVPGHKKSLTTISE